MELTIDTSALVTSLALSTEGELQAELTWDADYNHTAQLLPALNTLLKQAGAKLPDLKAVFVALGPGSYSSLRAGLATAKGLALALSIPLVGVGTLEAEAYPYVNLGLPICPLMDGGRGGVAYALFQQRRGKWQKLLPESIAPLQEVLPLLPRRTLFCGPMAGRLGEALRKRGIVISWPSSRAGALARLGWERLGRGERDDIATLQPLYLRSPSITAKGGSGAP